jgi:hypothetical protein
MRSSEGAAAGLDLLDLADFEDLLQLSQEESLFNAVSEGPVS